MKRHLLFSIFIALSYLSFSQSYTFSVDGKNYSENDTIVIYGDPTIDTTLFSGVFKNETTDGKNFGVVRSQSAPHSGTSNLFKWGEYNDMYTDTSSSYLFIPAKSQSPDNYFEGIYLPHYVVGISYIKYTFYNINFPEDQFNIMVEYNTVAFGFEENWLAIDDESEVFPNPANNGINLAFNTRLTETVNYKVLSLSGQVLIEGIQNPGSSMLSVDVSRLNTGLYLLTLNNNDGYSLSKKFMIRR